MTTATIGTRIKALREQHGLRQEHLAKVLGFKDRQTLSAIENGERKVSAEELLHVVRVFDVPVETFSDPFLLLGEGQFSWRHTGVAPEALNVYERDAGRLIAAFRTLAQEVGHETPQFRAALRLTKQSRFEDAAAAGERFVRDYGLGDVPADRLADVIERGLGILVLMVDAIDGVSGAACRLPELDAVLVNRREVAGRRNFDLAHELFHLLTWAEMPPERIEEVQPQRRTRVEQLADNFASALLMPQAAIVGLADWRQLDGEALITALNQAADRLGVTATALRWRLVNLNLLGRARVEAVPEASLRHNGHIAPEQGDLPSLASGLFMEVMGKGLEQGRISRRRLARLLGIEADGLGELFASHGVPTPDVL